MPEKLEWWNVMVWRDAWFIIPIPAPLGVYRESQPQGH